MADKKPLRVTTAFGPSRDETLLLTAHPDEQYEGDGPSARRRTLVLALKGSRATFVEERPVPLVRSWYSRATGTAYCTSVDTNKIHLWRAGRWSEETFASAPVEFVRFIFGIEGPTPQDNQLFLSTRRGLFTRVGNVWSQHKLRGEDAPYQIHGRTPSEVFIGGDTLWRWDGRAPKRIEPPDDDSADAVWVTADNRLVVGYTYLSITNATGGWERLATPGETVGVLAELNGALYATTSRGVVRVTPGGCALVSPLADVDQMSVVGDALVAMGDNLSLVGDGTSWQPIQVPWCEMGKRP